MKATHFVIALHDYFTTKASQKMITTVTSSADALEETPAETVNNTDTDSLPDTAVEDSWALEYINVRLIQPLIEAIDADGSSFVTVSELNDFTSCRPKGWRSVLKLMINSYYLTYNQSSSLDCILDDRL